MAPGDGCIVPQLHLAHLPSHLQCILSPQLSHLLIGALNSHKRQMSLSCPMFAIVHLASLLVDFLSLAPQFLFLSALQFGSIPIHLCFHLVISLLHCLHLEQVLHPFYWSFGLPIQIVYPSCERLIRLKHLRQVPTHRSLTLVKLNQRFMHLQKLRRLFSIRTFAFSTIETVIENIPALLSPMQIMILWLFSSLGGVASIFQPFLRMLRLKSLFWINSTVLSFDRTKTRGKLSRWRFQLSILLWCSIWFRLNCITLK